MHRKVGLYVMNCPHCGKVVKLVKDTNKEIGNSSFDYDDDNGRTASPSGIGDLLDRIDDDSLTGAAVDFVASTRARYEQYGDRIKLSEKQMTWLERLASL